VKNKSFRIAVEVILSKGGEKNCMAWRKGQGTGGAEFSQLEGGPLARRQGLFIVHKQLGSPIEGDGPERRSIMTRTWTQLSCLILAGLLTACSASGMKEVKKAGFLGDYSALKPGGEDRAALLYIKYGLDSRTYDKLMFERVTVWLSDDAAYKGIDPAVLKELTDYYQNALINAVKDAYQLVDQPGPGVLRVRVAITGLKPAKPVSNALSTVLPIGWVISGATKLTTDQNLGTGEAATEIELLDSVTGERVAAAVDRRQGGKAVFRGRWDDAKESFDFWAKRFRQRLDEARGSR
jgi:hypothetical protein